MVQDEQEGTAGDPPPWRDSLKRARQVVERTERDDTATGGLGARLAGARHIMAWGAVAAVLVLFAAGLLYLYARGSRAPEPVAVSADHTARRVKPEAGQGSADLPDAEVYDTLRSPPQDKTAAPTSEKAAGEAGRQAAGRSSQEAAPSSPAATAAPAGSPAASSPAQETRKAPPPPAAGAKAPPRPADAPSSLSPEEEAEQARALSGSYAVQIAAFHMRWRAEAFVNKAAFDHREVLKGLSVAIVPAEKDGQTFWRVRYGPFFDRASADAKCRQIRARKLNCIVVRVP